MAEMLNLTRLLRKLEKYERESMRQNNGNVVVGYSASYAVYVHENLAATHGEAFNARHAGEITAGAGRKKGERRVVSRGAGQQAKFLERPAREHKLTIAQMVVNGMKNGASLMKSLLGAGSFLLTKSREIVPWQTGNLYRSGFVEKE